MTKHAYRITGGPEADSVKVFAPDGTELTGIMGVMIAPTLPGGQLAATLTVACESNLVAERHRVTLEAAETLQGDGAD